MRAMLMSCVGVVVIVSGAAGRDDPPKPADPRDREIAVLRKENELLRKEVELLKKELELAKAGGGAAARPGDPAGPAKTTLDDVVYEFVSIKMDGTVARMKLAITSKKAGRVLDTQGIRLTTADGTEHRVPAIRVMKSAPGSAALPVNVRTVVELTIGELPEGVKEFATIQLPGVFNGSMLTPERMKNPVVLKGTFKVER